MSLLLVEVVTRKSSTRFFVYLSPHRSTATQLLESKFGCSVSDASTGQFGKDDVPSKPHDAENLGLQIIGKVAAGTDCRARMSAIASVLTAARGQGRAPGSVHLLATARLPLSEASHGRHRMFRRRPPQCNRRGNIGLRMWLASCRPHTHRDAQQPLAFDLFNKAPTPARNGIVRIDYQLKAR